MTEEMIALARRAVACKGWRWMPGMRCLVGPLHAPYRYVTHDYAPPEGKDVAFTDPVLPDLTDPATLGCLLALVREAWGDPHASVWYDSEYWQSGNRWSWHAKEQSLVDYDTEAEALVAALEEKP